MKEDYYITKRKVNSDNRPFRFQIIINLPNGNSETHLLKSHTKETAEIEAKKYFKKKYKKTIDAEKKAQKKEKIINYEENKLLNSVGRPRKEQNYPTVGNLLYEIFLKKDALYFEFHSVTPTQERKIRRLAEIHILSYWQDIRLKDVDLNDISKFRSFLTNKQKLALKYVKGIESYTKSAFKSANYIFKNSEFVNPYESNLYKKIILDPFANRTTPFRVEEVRLLFSQPFNDSRVMVMCLISACTGMRPNEIIALKYDDFIKYDGYYLINISKNWRPHEHVLAPPKTEAGKRKTAIPTWVFEIIDPILNKDLKDVCLRTNYKHPLDARVYLKGLREQAEKCGIQDYGKRKLKMYSFRPFYKSFAEPILGRNTSLMHYLMGHESGVTQDISDLYYHFEESNSAITILEVANQIFPQELREKIREDNIPKTNK